MQVTISDDDGIVLDSFDLSSFVANAKREFPNDDEETHRELAVGELQEDVSSAIRIFFGKGLKR